MKKTFLTVISMIAFMLPVVSFGHGTHSVQEHVTIQSAATQIVQIMERDQISISTLIDLLSQFETRLQGQIKKLTVLADLREATLDTYYEVDNFSMCESYSDGCNTCIVTNDYEIACTRRACLQQGTPECLMYAGDDTNGQDPISIQGIECENNGGQFNSLHNECEGIGESTCTELGGYFNECASACRHEAPGSICTMQCVLVCDFDSGDDMMGGGMTGIKTREVAPYKTECTGVGPMECLQIKELPFQENYELFYDTIEGFDFVEGNTYEITVEVTKIENPPADASSLGYELVEVLRTQPVTDHTQTQIDLDSAISLWNMQGPDTYTLTQTLSCFCTPEYTRPIMYMINNGVISSDTVYADGDQEMIDPDNSPTLYTIDGAFGIIQDAIDQYAASITVEYDETLGYPTSISIDYDEMMADEEAYYTFEIK